MSICSNCYTGCTQIITDKCIKYTGLDNNILGIKNGDSQSYVNQSLMGFVTANSTGEGVVFTIPEEFLCTAVSMHFPDCGGLNVIHITSALSKALCILNATVTDIVSAISALESTYLPGCINVLGTEGTHVILQATMAKVCSNTQAIAAINQDLITNYINVNNINEYIENYLNDNGGQEDPDLFLSRMVPYTVVEYYGSLSNFDASGAGTGLWVNIYLCNGNNNTPDKRGRVAVGTTNGMGGGSLAAEVNPAISGNPAYSLLDARGTNVVVLNSTQIPSHTHNITDPGHTHTVAARKGTMVGDATTKHRIDASNPDTYAVLDAPSTNNVSNNRTTNISILSTGGGEGHANIQPVLACHYIMYIPSA